jgi:nucleoside-diphosphate-sugar epimerase
MTRRQVQRLFHSIHSLELQLVFAYLGRMAENRPSVLITGANGFVGSRLCRKLLQEGFRVIAGVRKTADLSLLDGLEVEYRHGDITQPESLPAMVQGVNYAVHNAGIVTAKKPVYFTRVNEEGTRNFFNALKEHNPQVRKAVYISSLAAAGPAKDSRPRTEDDPPEPITAYGESKLNGERIALSFKNSINVVALRAAGVYGPGDKEILAFFKTVHGRIKPYFGNINRMLQLVHVDDLCDAVFQALLSEDNSGRAYYVAESEANSMKNLIQLLENAMNRRGFPLYIPTPLFYVIAFLSEWSLRLVGATPMLTVEKAGELLASWEVSTDRAQKELGFVSQIPFAQGARDTYKWYVEHGWMK